MTLSSFVRKSAFRNRRRSLLTMTSVGVSMLLLTVLMTIWRSFYIDQGPPDSGLRLMTRHRVSLTFFLPVAYRDKIRSLKGVQHVVPMIFYMGRYKDDRPENYFVSMATDPSEYLDVAADKIVDPEQVKAWQADRTGCLVDVELAKKHGWKLGDRIHLKGTYWPTDLDLTVRALYTMTPANNALYFNEAYLDESVPWLKGQSSFMFTRVDSPESVAGVAATVDEMFRNSPNPTRSESEHAFRLDFLAMMGNVKIFILTISGAVTFAILLVTANTMAMSVRERTRELAVLRTLGFSARNILLQLVSESVSMSLAGGILGILASVFILRFIGTSRPGVPALIVVTPTTMVFAFVVALMLGVASALIPSYQASRKGIAEGLRHVG
jgi:putative ABC transport system permease protein